MLQITTQRTTTPKAKPDESNLGFGVHYTDHMLIIDHDEEQGWHDARIVPYQPLELDPAAMVFHYAMESFEGLKAYRTPDGSIQLFRPDKNAQRMINTNHRMCLPSLPVEDFVQAVKAIVSFDQDWVPHAEGTSLYIRPFVIATEPHLGVRTSRTHKFIIVCSPVGAYYSTGINPVKIFVEDEYTRACPGGTGFT
ncbi:MAG: branched chain amino acid aminotransferase, partial [Butyricicoccus sp.]